MYKELDYGCGVFFKPINGCCSSLVKHAISKNVNFHEYASKCTPRQLCQVGDCPLRCREMPKDPER